VQDLQGGVAGEGVSEQGGALVREPIAAHIQRSQRRVAGESRREQLRAAALDGVACEAAAHAERVRTCLGSRA
jgi:hypothetical protein